MSDDIDVIEELKAAVESVRKSGPTDERQHFYQAEVARAFLAKHGPALIAAVELAEAVGPFLDVSAAYNNDQSAETGDLLADCMLAVVKHYVDFTRAAKLGYMAKDEERNLLRGTRGESWDRDDRLG